MIGIVGCGAMGGAMIARLVEKGHQVLCYDAMPEARARAVANGATACESLGALAQSCDQIILSLPKAEVVTSVMADLVPHVQAGTIILDTSTSEPDTTKSLAAAADGYIFLDGPVSGGPGGARAGTMTMVLGGPAAAIDALRPVLDDLTAKTVHVGPAGSGHAAKIANNLLCAANLVLVSEMARLAQSCDIPLDSLLQGVNAGSGRSGVSEVNFPKWILNGAYDSGFTMGLMRKDVGLATKLAGQGGLDLPATAAIAAIWENSRDTLADSADFNEIFKYGATDNV
ncbi:NAD(P)-dependent oxidoreductase [Marinovum sp. 2_MG-2023]|uniref:NAD(P)-dependent oxidoreductase n=1 Tax=unclassified Marinovum TaxID=2647166 RepID=UPI0026E1A8C1|nr:MULTISPECIES: NAD(P)-dependent oxidoreductase [unclassified Marinovum]MDO6730046.1 NAD(P)-dependent oxidoreductase [Marinovum sp. 2_MG-2023]MDO6779860.1 NAD(P)-dependent oxidoreductase [Marinovum sp. 1_MG-2023]